MRLLLYRVAVPKWGGFQNRVCGHLIGYAVSLDRWCLSFVWRKAPGRMASKDKTS